MNRNTIIAAFFALVFLGGQSALAQSGYDLFQKGLVKERTEGDLDEAIRLYKQIVEDHKDNRALVAKTLVQMGGCYEKLGRAEARKAYERVVRDYADQPETVAQARARLSKLSSADNKTASAISTRRVWARAGDAYAPSPDGRYLSYINWTTVELAVHDLKTGENRDLTDEGTWNKASEYPDRSIWSPDSRQVAYCSLISTVRSPAFSAAAFPKEGTLPRLTVGHRTASTSWRSWERKTKAWNGATKITLYWSRSRMGLCAFSNLWGPDVPDT
ncbi:MAG: tetratricopeptide repeat protein [Planctomycetota bacterium]|jgi:tetratricopeptide (TPR) repeat protein